MYCFVAIRYPETWPDILGSYTSSTVSYVEAVYNRVQTGIDIKMMSHISDDMSVDRFEKILEGTSVSIVFVTKPMCAAVLCYFVYRKSAIWNMAFKG